MARDQLGCQSSIVSEIRTIENLIKKKRLVLPSLLVQPNVVSNRERAQLIVYIDSPLDPDCTKRLLKLITHNHT